MPLLHHHQHPFLRFGQQDFPGRHVRLAFRHPIQLYAHAAAPLGAHLRGAAYYARGPHILHAHYGIGLRQL